MHGCISIDNNLHAQDFSRTKGSMIFGGKASDFGFFLDVKHTILGLAESPWRHHVQPLLG